MAKRGFQQIKRLFSRSPDGSQHNRTPTWRLPSIASDPFPPLKQAISGIVESIEAFENVAKNHQGYHGLKKELDTLFRDISKYFDGPVQPALMPSIVNLAKGLEQETNLLQQKLNRRVPGRYLDTSEDTNELLECYRRIQGMFQRLSLNANTNIWNTVEEQAMETRLKNLPNSPAATYRSAESVTLLRGGCTQNTRVEVVEQLQMWACDNHSENICWLNGMAGTGKTTIAYTLCQRLEEQCKLAASFFCSRELPACHEVNRIIPSISYQLARFSRPFCFAISQVLATHPDVFNQSLHNQFRQLIFNPLSQVEATLPSNLIVVVDALDECDDNHGIGQILDILLSCRQRLPVKFLVASRPEAIILNHLRSQDGTCIPTELCLHKLARSSVQGDIKTYFVSKLRPQVDLSVRDLDTLAERSGILFIHAATVVQYIEAENFSWAHRQLREVLDASKRWSDYIDRKMDKLYAPILEAAFRDPEPAQLKRAMKLILDTVVCAQEPLSVNALASLLGLDDEVPVRFALRRLGSVLQVADRGDVITTLHKSFHNHLFDETRSHEFYCDAKSHNAYLAQSCFGQINTPNQPFNTRSFMPSYVSDEGAPNLGSEYEKDISEELFYACRYWVFHLVSGEISQHVSSMLCSFLSEHLLLWMEVMNLKKCINDGKGMLCQMQEWSQTTNCLDEGTKQLIRDACILTISFSSSPVTLDTPHIYVSELSLWGAHRPITTHDSQEQSRPITGAGTKTSVRRTTPLAITNTGENVCSLAYSPDEAYIVSASHDCTLHIWDVHTGQEIGQPLHGHTSAVTSIAYSPNGAYIVSSSDDGTIRIWDTRSGQTIKQLLSGHTSGVNSVAYSPDGAYIASGSDDKTIRIWDTLTGQTIKRLLNGHTGGVNSIAYSPDGAHIVSGSSDGTIRIWNARTGWKIGPPLKGHTNNVNSLAYLPGGTHIVSSSDDKTIRIWDASTGQTVGQPLKGYTMGVNSVLCSSDSAYIVSVGKLPIALYVAHYETLV